ncbi:MAG: ABC transporter ATP-binding protein [Solirubrobacteraceae bacterium]
MDAVIVENLTKRFGEFAAVEGVSFTVPAGQLVAVLGPNGAGKTTTLEMLEGFLAPSSGTVRVLGADPRRGDRAWRARVGLVLQSTSLDDALTVRATLELYSSLYSRPWRVDELLELIDLSADADTRVGVLSGGQRRRVDLAIGIIGRPEVLFLDEPTTGLDPEARRRTWTAVENLTQAGTTVLLTTHYIDEADHLADRLIVLAGGKIVTDTTPGELRAMGGPATIRYPLPETVHSPDLPTALAGHLDRSRRAIFIRTTDLAGDLRELVAWAAAQHVDLAGLEVGPPSLEDAYLATIGEPLIPEVSTDAQP